MWEKTNDDFSMIYMTIKGFKAGNITKMQCKPVEPASTEQSNTNIDQNSLINETQNESTNVNLYVNSF
jgi:hypothetical protein